MSAPQRSSRGPEPAAVPSCARTRLRELLDQDPEPLDAPLETHDMLGFDDGRSYLARVREAREQCRSDEAFLSGEGTIGGCRVLAGAFEFAFLGGGMGCVVGERIAQLFDAATARDLPVVIVHRSGGARMQEGTWSLLQMAKVCAAVARHRAGHRLYVSILADPSMGGTLASSGALGDIILAEAGARIGFAGPRVTRETIGVEIPPEVQTAERLRESGFVDRVIAATELRETLARLLAVRVPKPLHARRAPAQAPALTLPRSDAVSRMETIRASRHPRRPRFAAWIECLCDEFFELHGDRLGGEDAALRGGLARFARGHVMLIGTDRGVGLPELKRRNFGMPGAAGYRKARRLLQLAEKLRIPVVTLIDTPGADASAQAEIDGQAFAIAEAIAAIVNVTVPVVGFVFGEGGSGGAVALAATDHLVMLERTHLSVISPEGCAAILWRSKRDAARAAELLRSTAPDLVAAGLADEWLPEPAGEPLPEPPSDLVVRVRASLEAALAELLALRPEALLARRAARLRRDACARALAQGSRSAGSSA